MSRALRRRALRATGLLIAIALVPDRHGHFAFSVPSTGGGTVAAVAEAEDREAPAADAPVQAPAGTARHNFRSSMNQPYYLKLNVGYRDLRNAVPTLGEAEKADDAGELFASWSKAGDWNLAGEFSKIGGQKARKSIVLSGSKQKVLALFKDFLDGLQPSEKELADRVSFLVPTVVGDGFKSVWYGEDSTPKGGIRVAEKKYAPAGERRLKVLGGKEEHLAVVEALLNEAGKHVEVARTHANTRYLPDHAALDIDVRMPLKGSQGLQILGRGGKFIKILCDEFPVKIQVAKDLSYVELSGMMGDVWAAQGRIMKALSENEQRDAQRKSEQEES